MMNITISVKGSNVNRGLASTLYALDNVKLSAWVSAKKPVYDMLEETQPDIVILNGQELTPIYKRALEEYKTPVVVLGLPTIEIPQIQLVCFDNTIPPKIRENFCNDNPNIQNYYIYPAANIASFNNGKYNENYKSDIFYLSEMPNQEILKSLEFLISQEKYCIKCAGPNKLGYIEYIGMTNLQDVLTFLASTKIALVYDEETALDYASNKTFYLSPDQYDIDKQADKFIADIEHFLDDEKHRRHFIKENYKHVLQSNTYFHHVINIFKLIKDENMAKHTEDTLNKKFIKD